MPYSYPEIRTLKGLYLQPNTFTVPDGACENANNVVIKNDNMITSRRGYYNYFIPLTGNLNKLFNYQNTLMGVYTDKIAYYSDTGTSPNKTGVEHLLSGATVSISGVSRSIQANQNLFLTTDNGILKLTAFNSAISQAGAPPGLDIELNFKIGATASWFLPGYTVGYRILFGYVDANNNKILGAPSQIAQINNSLVVGSSYTSSGSGSAYTITVTSTAHGLTTGMYMAFSSSTSAAGDGTYQITVTGANTFTYLVTSNPSTGTTSYGYAMPVLVEMSLPSVITAALPWFFEVYRSSQQLIATGLFDDFKLITQVSITAADIAAGVVFFTDDILDILRGEVLYTNENSGEGENQSNYQPPLAQDIAYFKNYAMYGNCQTRQMLNLSVIDTSQLAANDYIQIAIGAVTKRYVAVTGVANQTVYGTCSSSTGLLITYNAHGFSNGWQIYVSNITGGTLVAGTYLVASVSTNSFKITTLLGVPIAYNGETSLYFEGLTNGTYPIFFLSTSSSAAVQLQATANYLVKAINGDSTSLVYGQYISPINGVPGQMLFQAIGFGDPIYVDANTLTAGSAFSPALPNSFGSGTQVYSINDVQPNALYISKISEPEAVPLVNFLLVGSKNYQILRIEALRDSVIIIKQDGVFRLVGDDLSNFAIFPLDLTVVCVASSSVDVLNNQVVFLSNQGVCMVSESSVQIVSREKLENVIQPILGQPLLSTQTSGMGYETERLYLITTTQPNTTEASITYAYNILTNEWTSWGILFAQGFVGPGDIMYYISRNNTIVKERKNQNKIDYSDQNYPVTINSISGSGAAATANITVTGGVPKQGDIIVKNDVVTWIAGFPVLIAGDTYSVVFDYGNNLLAGDSLVLYSAFYKTIKWSPFHAGEVSRMKFFAQFTLMLRDNSMTACTIDFAGNVYGSSAAVDWVTSLTYLGWGEFPWGFEPWGQVNSINLSTSTNPAPIVRTYVPAYEARGTFLQPSLTAWKAGEPLNIQSIMYTIRPYTERVSR